MERHNADDLHLLFYRAVLRVFVRCNGQYVMGAYSAIGEASDATYAQWGL